MLRGVYGILPLVHVHVQSGSGGACHTRQFSPFENTTLSEDRYHPIDSEDFWAEEMQ